MWLARKLKIKCFDKVKIDNVFGKGLLYSAFYNGAWTLLSSLGIAMI